MLIVLWELFPHCLYVPSLIFNPDSMITLSTLIVIWIRIYIKKYIYELRSIKVEWCWNVWPLYSLLHKCLWKTNCTRSGTSSIVVFHNILEDAHKISVQSCKCSNKVSLISRAVGRLSIEVFKTRIDNGLRIGIFSHNATFSVEKYSFKKNHYIYTYYHKNLQFCMVSEELRLNEIGILL